MQEEPTQQFGRWCGRNGVRINLKLKRKTWLHLVVFGKPYIEATLEIPDHIDPWTCEQVAQATQYVLDCEMKKLGGGGVEAMGPVRFVPPKRTLMARIKDTLDTVRLAVAMMIDHTRGRQQ